MHNTTNRIQKKTIGLNMFICIFRKQTYNMVGKQSLWYLSFVYMSYVSVPVRTALTFGKQTIWAASSEFGTYRICEQRRFRWACASAQSCQNLRCSLIQAVSQEEPSDRKPDPWPLWMAGHAQLKFVITDCSKTQIRLTGLICHFNISVPSR